MDFLSDTFLGGSFLGDSFLQHLFRTFKTVNLCIINHE